MENLEQPPSGSELQGHNKRHAATRTKDEPYRVVNDNTQTEVIEASSYIGAAISTPSLLNTPAFRIPNFTLLDSVS